MAAHDFYSTGSCGELPRYFDSRFNAVAVKILPGQHYVTDRPDEMLVTVLGSCVAACIRDPVAGVGGMNHFMLPESLSGHWGTESAALRFGNHALAQLMAEVLWRNGRADRLEAKLFGGSNGAGARVGDDNAAFALRFLRDAGVRVLAQHLGGTLPRAIKYFPMTGRVLMRQISEGDAAMDEEKAWPRKYAS